VEGMAVVVNGASDGTKQLLQSAVRGAVHFSPI